MTAAHDECCLRGPLAAGADWPVARVRRLAEAVASGRQDVQVVPAKRRDVLTARAALDNGTTVIVKLWDRRGVGAWWRRLTRTGAAQREWLALTRLHAAGVAVPRPLGCFRLDSRQHRFTDALVVQDLGPCCRCSELLTTLLAQERWQEAGALEDRVIETTAAMLRAGIVDTDHSLMDFVVPAD
jgi:hypothetical protein